METTVVDAARAFVESFVVPNKRERYLNWLKRERTHGKFLRELDHLRWLDERNSRAVPRTKQSTEEIEQALRAHGAPDQCIVISANEDECRESTLHDALGTVVGGTAGAIVSCIPGRLAYYEAEEPFERFICLVKRSDATREGSDR